jgi:hypothetical protein
MEQTAVYDKWVTMESNLTGSNINPWTGVVLALADNPFTQPVSYMHCPSNANSRNAAPSTNYAGTSYRPSVGDGMWHNNENSAFSPTNPYPDNAKVTTRGAFTVLNWKGFGVFTDGLSNTVAMSEGCNGTAYDDPTIKAGVALVTTIYSGGAAKPNDCFTTVRDPSNKSLMVASKIATGWRGLMWCDGRSIPSSFCTVLPPNSPSCIYNQTGVTSWGVYSASSFHTSGVNVLLMDGAVRFVSETIDCGNDFTKLQAVSGPSPYGVWGAVGTPQGSETNSLF